MAQLRRYYLRTELFFFRAHALTMGFIFAMHFIMVGEEISNVERYYHYFLFAGLAFIILWSFFQGIGGRFLYPVQMILNISTLVYLLIINILNRFPCHELMFLFFVTIGVIAYPRTPLPSGVIFIASTLVVEGGLIFGASSSCIDNVYLALLYPISGLIPFAGVYFFNLIASALNRVRRMLEALFDNYYDALLLVDNFTKKIKDCNEAAVALLNARSKEELKKHYITEFGLDFTGEHENIELQKNLAIKGYHRIRRLIKTMDGKQIWTDVVLTPFYYANTQFFIIRLNDISEWVKAEEEVKRSELFHRLLFEMSPAGIFRSTIDGTLLTCNKSFARILGYNSPDEIIGKKATMFYVDVRDREQMIGEIRKKQYLYGYKMRLKRKDGQVITVLENIHLNRENEKEILEGALVDITFMEDYTKKIEDKFKEIERMLTIAGVVTYRAIVLPHGETKVDYISGNVDDIFGFTYTDFIERKITPRDYVLPEDLQKIIPEVNKVKELNLPARYVYRIKHLKTGEIKWIEETRIPYYDEVSGQEMVFGVARDVSHYSPGEPRVIVLYRDKKHTGNNTSE